MCAIASAPSLAEPFDPTRPPVDLIPLAPVAVEQSEETLWVLNSILWSPSRRVAVINGIHVQAGDSVGGAAIVAIETSSVRLHGADGEFTLELHSPVKTPADEQKSDT